MTIIAQPPHAPLDANRHFRSHGGNIIKDHHGLAFTRSLVHSQFCILHIGSSRAGDLVHGAGVVLQAEVIGVAVVGLCSNEEEREEREMNMEW